MKNKDNIKYFNHPGEADNWVWRIENGVSDWINKQGKKGKGDKSYWKLVFWVSQTHLRILNESITLREFAQLLMEECHKVFQDEETRYTLFHSMEKFPYTGNLNDFERQPDSSFVRTMVGEVEELLTKAVEMPMEMVPTLEQRMLEFANNALVTGCYDKVCVNPTYNGKRVSLSVEKYISQKFKDENRPTFVMAFECVEDVVTEETIYSLYGKFSTFSSKPTNKLYVVSTNFFTKRTQDEAESHNMGLVLVNLEYEVDEHCFILPRSSVRKNYTYWRQMLSGEQSMTLPFIACDGPFLFYSMSGLLKSNNFSVIAKEDIKAPFLTYVEIEKEAMHYVQSQIDCFLPKLQQCGDQDPIPYCMINPYEIAHSLGLRVVRGDTGNNISTIDIENKIITISNDLRFDFHRALFGVSHEIGHFIFHRDMIMDAKKRLQVIGLKEQYWMERHANYFASCLLMPATLVRLLYHIYYRRETNGSMVMPLLVNDDNYPDFARRIIKKLADNMCVSVEAMAIRLEKMGLISKESPMPPYLPEAF